MGVPNSKEKIAAGAGVVAHVAKDIQSYLEPCADPDELLVEHFTGASRACVDMIQEEIEKLNKKIKMDGLNIDSMFQKALSLETSEVF